MLPHDLLFYRYFGFDRVFFWVLATGLVTLAAAQLGARKATLVGIVILGAVIGLVVALR
jgi:hypothetical protein